MKDGLIFDLKRFALHDGPGIRLTVFLKGCPLRCWWCHNPESMLVEQQITRRENKIGDRIIGWQNETVGTYFSVNQIMSEIEKEILFFDDSRGGVTFSGGEPLMQVKFLQAVLTRCKASEIHTALDTSGFAPFSAFEQILDDLDLILYDLKLLDDGEHKTYTGVSNKLILDNLKQLAFCKKKIIIRFPVIPGITDSRNNISALVQLLKDLKTITHIALLPFHNIAISKYDRLDMENKLTAVESLTAQDLKPLQTELESQGFEVSLGG